MSTEQEQLEGVRMEPRVSKSGKAYYWFWDELPGHIKIDLRQEDGFKLEEQGPDAKYSYSVKRNDKGGFTVFRNFIGKRASPEIRTQRVEDRKGLEGGGSYSEGAKKGHEENVAMHEEDKQMHDERMLLDRALLDAIALLKQEIRDWREDENRREQRELGETKE